MKKNLIILSLVVFFVTGMIAQTPAKVTKEATKTEAKACCKSDDKKTCDKTKKEGCCKEKANGEKSEAACCADKAKAEKKAKK